MSKKKSSRYKQTKYQNVKKGGSPAVKNIYNGQQPAQRQAATYVPKRGVSNTTIILSVVVVALMAMVTILFIGGGSPDTNGAGDTLPGDNTGDGTLLVSPRTVPAQGNPAGT